MDAAAVVARKKPQERSVEILTDPQLATLHAELEAELRREERRDELTNERDKAPAVRKRLEELTDEIEEATTTFVVRAMPQLEFADLVAAHPAPPEVLADGQPYDVQGLGPPLLLASIVEPTGMTMELAEEIWNTWSDGEVTRLFIAAIAVNRDVRNVPFTRRRSEGTETSEKS